MGTGAAALVSRSVGAGDQAEADKVAGQALALAFLLGLVMAAMGYFSAGTLFSLSRTEPPVQHLAADYLRIVSRATLFMLPLFVKCLLRAWAIPVPAPLLLALLPTS